MKKILISIDHKWRDLPGHVLLGEYLTKKGMEVTYCRNGLERYYLDNVNYNYVVINHIFESSRQILIKEYALRGVQFIILPTEGIPTLEDFTDFALGVELDYSGVACYAFWNSLYLKRFKKNSTMNLLKIYIAGVPRFDFYKHKNLAKISTYKFKTNSPSKKILWATNFTQAQFHEPKKSMLLEADSIRLGYKEVLEKMQGSLPTVAKKDYYARQNSLDIMCRFIQDHPNIQLVLKPHPSEDGTFYEKFLHSKGISNKRAVVVKNEYIWDLLKWCDVEVSRSCTTAVEAWHLKKPTIDLNPDKSWYHSHKHSSGSYEAGSYEELLVAMKQSLIDEWKGNHTIRLARSKFINTYCEGRESYRTRSLADAIYNLDEVKKKQRHKKHFSFKSWCIFIMLKYFDHFPHSIRVYGFSYLLGNRIDRFGRSDKYFHNNDIRKWKNLLAGEVN